MKIVTDGLLLLSAPFALIVGNRWAWSRKWCDAIGNVLWNDN
jgi:hypothetical protein